MLVSALMTFGCNSVESKQADASANDASNNADAGIDATPLGPDASTNPSAPRRGRVDITGFENSGLRQHCQSVTFPTPFPAQADVRVIATAHHLNDPTPSATYHDGTTLWVQDVSATGFEVCLSEMSDAAVDHDDAVDVDWYAFVEAVVPSPLTGGSVAIADDTPTVHCADVTTGAFSGTPFVQLTPVYTAPVGRPVTAWLETVTSTGFRYCVDTLALELTSVTGLRLDFIAYESEPFGHIATRVDIPAWTALTGSCADLDISCINEANCPITFLAVTPNHDIGGSDHESVSHWVEGVRDNGTFRVCLMETDRYDDTHPGDANIDILLELDPIAQSGRLNLLGWLVSPHCEPVTFARPFTSTPHIIVSGNHTTSTTIHAGTTFWAKDVTTNGFTVCGSEFLSQADTSHAASVKVDWLAFTDVSPAPDFARGSIAVPDFFGVSTPQCADVDIASAGFTSVPIVIPSITFTAGSGPASTVWMEAVTTTTMRYCVDTLATDPLHTATDMAVDYIMFETTPGGFVSGSVDFPMFSSPFCQLVDVGCVDAACPHKTIQVSLSHDPDADHDAVTVWAEGFDAAGNLNICASITERFTGTHDSHLNVHWLLELP